MISSILTQRWDEASAQPTVQRWIDTAQIAAVIADNMEQYSLEDAPMMAAAYRGIYEEAYKRASQLMDKEQA